MWDDEFAPLADNAEQAGVTGPLPAVQRVEVGALSALRWGTTPVRVVDLPGHGRSAWRDDGDYTPQRNAAAVAPHLVRRLAVVDVTPSALQRHSQMSVADRGTVALAQGPRTFPDFASMLEVTVAAAPHRDRRSLRRGVFHNARQLPDGRWTWRYDTPRTLGDFAELWADVSAITAPTTLIRGADSPFVADADVAEYARRSPGLTVHVVPDCGHSVQSDQPRALVELLRVTVR